MRRLWKMRPGASRLLRNCEVKKTSCNEMGETTITMWKHFRDYAAREARLHNNQTDTDVAATFEWTISYTLRPQLQKYED